MEWRQLYKIEQLNDSSRPVTRLPRMFVACHSCADEKPWLEILGLRKKLVACYSFKSISQMNVLSQVMLWRFKTIDIKHLLQVEIYIVIIYYLTTQDLVVCYSTLESILHTWQDSCMLHCKICLIAVFTEDSTISHLQNLFLIYSALFHIAKSVSYLLKIALFRIVYVPKMLVFCIAKGLLVYWRQQEVYQNQFIRWVYFCIQGHTLSTLLTFKNLCGLFLWFFMWEDFFFWMLII